MRTFALLVSVCVAQTDEPVCDDASDEVCLLQTQHFMQGRMGNSGHGDVAQCPGKPFHASAQAGKCTYMGASVVVADGLTSITEFFGDNVDIKEFHYYLREDQKDLWLDLAEHAFPVGRSLVHVEGKDLAGNTRRCYREVVITDTQKPTWQRDPDSVERKLTMEVDETCTLPAAVAFQKYEETGWLPEAEDNCGDTTVRKQVLHKGKVIYDDSTEASDLLNEGPGEYEMVYTATDANGLVNRHSA